MSSFEFDAEIESENTSELFTDFQSNEFSQFFNPSRLGKQGEIIDMRTEIIAEINSALSKPDLRPKVMDRNSGKIFVL